MLKLNTEEDLRPQIIQYMGKVRVQEDWSQEPPKLTVILNREWPLSPEVLERLRRYLEERPVFIDPAIPDPSDEHEDIDD